MGAKFKQVIYAGQKLVDESGGGGGDVSVESLSVTSNGTYTAPEGKAYSPVTVNVSGGGSGDTIPFPELTYNITFQSPEHVADIDVGLYEFDGEECTRIFIESGIQTETVIVGHVLPLVVTPDISEDPAYVWNVIWATMPEFYDDESYYIQYLDDESLELVNLEINDFGFSVIDKTKPCSATFTVKRTRMD